MTIFNSGIVVIELLGYKISKTYTTDPFMGSGTTGCYRTIRLQNFKDIHNVPGTSYSGDNVVIELLGYKISKTYTTDDQIAFVSVALL